MRRQYKGNTLATSLSGGITSGATSFVVASGGGSSFPDATVGPFVITLNLSGTTEEKILVGTRTGDTFSSLTRGYDGTAAAAHSAGETVRHTISAVDLDEANAHINTTTRDDHAQYALRGQGLSANVGAASRAGRFYIATDSEDLYTDDGTVVHRLLSKPSADAAYAPISSTTAWTAYTPTLGGITLGNGTISAAYKLNGKTLHFRLTIFFGSTTSVTGAITATLPASLNVVAALEVVAAYLSTGAGAFSGLFSGSGGSNVISLVGPTSGTATALVAADGTHPTAWSSSGTITASGTLEVA